MRYTSQLYTLYIICYDKIVKLVQIIKKAGGCMAEKEMIQRNIEEFSRLQKYMILTENKESAAYKEMKDRYIELKVILTASGINLTELDKIKE